MINLVLNLIGCTSERAMISKFKSSDWFKIKNEWVLDFNRNRNIAAHCKLDSWLADIWMGSISNSYTDENGWHDLYVSDVMCLTSGRSKKCQMLRFLMPVTDEIIKNIRFEKGDLWAFISIRKTNEMCNIISSAVRLEYDHSRRILNLSDIVPNNQDYEISSGICPLPD